MKSIVWRGLIYKSREDCEIDINAQGCKVESEIIGNYQNNLFKMNYSLTIDKQWLISTFTIEAEINGQITSLKGSKEGKEWTINDVVRPEFEGFNYIDISLTPFTNTLPINNLMLKADESSIIDVIYLNIFEKQIKAVKQRYTKKSEEEYLYESFDSNFSSSVIVGQDGIVKTYPGLFEILEVRSQ